MRRLLVRAGALLLLLFVAVAAWFFPRAGRYLVVRETLEKSDAIVVLAGSRVERWREAIHLYREGWAPLVVLSPGRVEEAEVSLREMGVRYPSDAELARDALVQLQVPASAVSILPGSLDNTAQEGQAVRAVAIARGWKQVIVVTSKYHTRRVDFAFARELRGTGVNAIVHPSRYDTATPDSWWRTRADFRFVVSELQKLLAYRLGLGG